MTNELYHYGVKGMKWGVRNDYVPIGRSKPNKFITDNGTSSSRDERIKKNRFKLSTGAKVALGVAGISAAAVIGMEAYKIGKFRADSLIPPGTLVQNIAPAGRTYDTSFYGAISQKDRLKYLSTFTGAVTKKGNSNINVSMLSNDNSLKIAGKKAMNQAYKNVYGKTSLVSRSKWFNNFGALSEAERKPFMDELSRKGYSGFKDADDILDNFGDMPVVFFGDKSGLSVKKTVKLNTDITRKMHGQKSTRNLADKRKTAERFVSTVGGVSLATATGIETSRRIKNGQKRRSTKRS